jgi:hypothetical protein
MSKIVAKKDLYLNATEDAVVLGGETAAFLLAREGREIPPQYDELVTAGGLPRAQKKSEAGESGKESAPADNKAAAKPKNKGASK